MTRTRDQRERRREDKRLKGRVNPAGFVLRPHAIVFASRNLDPAQGFSKEANVWEHRCQRNT
jgi:hypothetical protein